MTSGGDLIYCVYDDRWVSSEEASREHVIPLALGGVDAFAITVSRSANSILGSQLDGALANEFFMLQRRNELDVRGRSGVRPIPVIKQATMEAPALPVQVELDKRERALRVFSPRATGSKDLADASPNVFMRLRRSLAIHRGVD